MYMIMLVLDNPDQLDDVLEALDRERVTVASALGLRARTGLEWLQMAYNTVSEDLHKAIHN